MSQFILPSQQISSIQKEDKILDHSKIKLSDLIFPWGNQFILNPIIPLNSLPFPQYFRSVTSIFPGSPECQKQCQIPFSVILTPASPLQVPIVDYYKALDTIPHCTSCSSYLCPDCKILIINGQHSWSCAVCGKANAFPNVADPNVKIPFDNLLELSNSVYDIIAPPQYYHMYSQSAYAFIIDMSYSAYSSGFTHQFLSTIQQLIDIIPLNSRICIITMSDSLSVFDFNKSQEIVIPDLSELCLTAHQESVFPLLSESKFFFQKIIKILLSRVPTNKESGNCLLSAMIIAEMIMKEVGGLAIVGCVNMPKEGPFELKNRTGNSELELLQLPDCNTGKAFQEEAIRLNESGISVHLFCSYDSVDSNNSPPYCDITTISILSRLTNGKLHFYGNFDDMQRKKLNNDLFETLSGRFMWDSSLHIRYSFGLKLIKIYSNCIFKNSNSVYFPVLSKDDSIAFEFIVEKPILQSQVLFQFSILFTTNEGERIIRVFNFKIPKSNDPRLICKSIDEASLMAIITHHAILRSLEEGPQNARCYIKKEISHIFSSGTKFSSLVFLLNSLLLSRVLRNIHPNGVDGRMATFVELYGMSNNNILLYFYPRMFNVNESEFSILPLGNDSFLNGFCFVIHTYNKIYIKIQKNADANYLKNAFDACSFEDIPFNVPKLETQENLVLQNLINDCWSFSGKFLQTEIICQGNTRESILSEFMIDDENSLQELVRELNF